MKTHTGQKPSRQRPKPVLRCKHWGGYDCLKYSGETIMGYISIRCIGEQCPDKEIDPNKELK